MKRSRRFVVTLSIGMSVLFGLHLYVYARLIAAPGWPSAVRAVALASLLVFLCNFLFVFFTRERHYLPRALESFSTKAAYLWVGCLFLMALATFAVDVVGFLVNLFLDSPVSSRQKGWASLAASGAMIANGLREGIGPTRVRKVAVQIKRWPDNLAGFSIVQLSDVHIGPLLKRDWLTKVVNKVNALNADLIVITGDLVDGPYHRFSDEVAPLANLKATHGVYFVTGNHEFYSGVKDWLPKLSALGLRILEGEVVSIGDGDRSFDLFGMHDHTAPHFGKEYHCDIQGVLGRRDKTRPLIALAHQPKSVFDLEGNDVDLQLSGHTHGGQMWPFTSLVILEQPYVHGLNQHDENMQVYVSRGTGFWGPPMRLLAPAEITEIVVYPT